MADENWSEDDYDDELADDWEALAEADDEQQKKAQAEEEAKKQQKQQQRELRDEARRRKELKRVRDERPPEQINRDIHEAGVNLRTQATELRAASALVRRERKFEVPQELKTEADVELLTQTLLAALSAHRQSPEYSSLIPVLAKELLKSTTKQNEVAELLSHLTAKKNEAMKARKPRAHRQTGEKPAGSEQHAPAESTARVDLLANVRDRAGAADNEVAVAGEVTM